MTSDTVKSAERTMAILEAICELDGADLSAVAAEVGCSKSTAHRHIATLEEHEYIVREGDTYYVGLRFLRLGELARNRKDSYRMAGSKVAELAEATDERAQFIVEEHGRGVYVYRETGRRAVQTDSGIGKRVPLHATSAGKAILASLPGDHREEIVQRRGLEAITDNTITDREALAAEIETIRERGYAINDQENIDGLRAMGVPIQVEGRVIGALSVSGPTHRMRGEWFQQDLPELLLGTANELEINVAHA